MELYEKVYDFLKAHTYKEAAIEFNISEKQISRVKKYMQEQEKTNIPEEATELITQLQVSQPESMNPGSGSATGINPQDQEKLELEEEIQEEAEAVKEEPQPTLKSRKQKGIDQKRADKIFTVKSYKEDKNLYYQQMIVINRLERILSNVFERKVTLAFE